MKKSGVYKIQNTETNDFYIGSSNDVKARQCKHRRLLRKNSHWNKHLQASFNKHGEDSFIFSILLLCEPEERLKYEQMLINKLSPIYNKIYNGKIVEKHYRKDTIHLSREYNKRVPRSNDIKQKLSLALKGRPNNFLAKTYKGFISPDGIIFKNVTNLSEFCRKHNLSQGNLHSVAVGKRQSHKGWTCYSIIEG